MCSRLEKVHLISSPGGSLNENIKKYTCVSECIKSWSLANRTYFPDHTIFLIAMGIVELWMVKSCAGEELTS